MAPWAVFMGLVATLTLLAVSAAVGPTGPVPVRIDFAAPAGCADADDFWNGITSRTERARTARPGDAAMRMTVRLTRAGAKVRGELRIAIPGGHPEARKVEGATCVEVVQVLSLTAALAIDPSATIAPVAPITSGTGRTPASPADSSRGETAAAPNTPKPAVPAPPTPEAPPPPAPPPRPTVEQPPPPRPEADRDRGRDRPEPGTPPVVVRPAQPPEPGWGRGPAMSAAAVAARLLTDSFSAGGEISARLASHTHAPSLTASFLFLAGDFLHSGDDLGLRWIAGALDGCPGWILGHVVSVEPCVRVTAGALTLTDHDVTNPQTVTRWWGSGGLVAHAEAELGAGFWLRAELGVDFPVVERRFGIAPAGTATAGLQQVGATASISPTLALGVGHGL